MRILICSFCMKNVSCIKISHFASVRPDNIKQFCSSFSINYCFSYQSIKIRSVSHSEIHQFEHNNAKQTMPVFSILIWINYYMHRIRWLFLFTSFFSSDLFSMNIMNPLSLISPRFLDCYARVTAISVAVIEFTIKWYEIVPLLNWIFSILNRIIVK